MNENNISLNNENNKIKLNTEIIEKLITKHNNLLNNYNSDLREINEYLITLENEIKEIKKSININVLEIKKIIDENIVKNYPYLKIDFYSQYSKIERILEKKDDLIQKYDNELIQNIQSDIVSLINKNIDEGNEDSNLKNTKLKVLTILNSIIFKVDELNIKEKIFLENKQKSQVSEFIKINEEAISYWKQELSKINEKNE